MKHLLKIATLAILTLPIAYGLRDKEQGKTRAAMADVDRPTGFPRVPNSQRGNRADADPAAPRAV